MIEILSVKNASFMLYSAKCEIFDAVKIVTIINAKEHALYEILAVILVNIPLKEINIMLIKIKVTPNKLTRKKKDIVRK